MNQCKHTRTERDESSIRCYGGSVAVPPHTDENRAAAGAITYIEKCLDCGCERAVNANGRHIEVAPWGKSRALRASEGEAKQEEEKRKQEDT